MSKRQILEDSDEDGDDAKAPANANDAIFTPEELRAIENCNIATHDEGQFSPEQMSLALAAALDFLEETDSDATHAHEGYCVKKEAKESFFDRDLFSVHDGGGDGGSPSEEAILLAVEAVRRSKPVVKKQMFRKKKRGVLVVFGPWWNYAFRRLMAACSEGSVDDDTLGGFTAVMIVRSLFSLLKDDLSDVLKNATLKKMKKNFDLDLTRCMEVARHAINRGGPSSVLDGELSAVEAFVQGLAGTATAVPAAAPPAAAPAAASSVGAKKQSEDASKSRIAAMKERMLKQRSLAAVASSTTPAASSSVASGQSSSAPAALKSPPEQLVNRAAPPPSQPQRAAPPPSQPPASVRPSGGQQPASGGTSQAFSRPPESNGGWGRNREGPDAPEPPKTKGSWAFRRNTCGRNIPVDDPPPPRDPPREMVQRNMQPNDARAPGDGFGRDREPRREYDSRGGDRRDDRRDYDPRSSDRGGGDGRRYDQPREFQRQDSRGRDYDHRSSDRGRDDYPRGDSRSFERSGSRGGEGSRDFGRSDSRGSRDYGRSDARGDGDPRGGPRDYARSDSGGAGYALSQGSKHARGPDRDDRPQKRFCTNEPAPPTAGAGRGRGRGVNKPAWMVEQERNGTLNLPGAPQNGSVNPGATASALSNNDLSNLLSGIAPAPAPVAGGRGGGPSSYANRPAAAPMGGAGRGRGRGANRPAWMKDDDFAQHLNSQQQQQAPAPQVQQPPPRQVQQPPAQPMGGFPNAGQGRGRGRGRGNTLPAWMTRGEGPGGT